MKFALPTTFTALTALTCVRSQALSTTPYNFTLAAVNVDSPNANTTGAPLVLGSGGATGGISLYSTSTWNSFPPGNINKIALTNYALHAFFADGSEGSINATAVRTPGDPLTWISSLRYGAPQEKNAVYSVVNQAGAFPRLAVNTQTDVWSLCPDKAGNRPQTRLIFDVASLPVPPPSFVGYDPATCYKVVVNVNAV